MCYRKGMATPHLELVTRVPDSRFALVSRNDGGVLLLPFYSGEPMGERPLPRFAPDGATFTETSVDLSELPSRAAPILTPLSDTASLRWATDGGLLFMKSGSDIYELTIGPELAVRPSEFRGPHTNFDLAALTIHDGSWWAGGHDRLAYPDGELYSSPDGRSWTLVPGTYDSIRFFLPQAGRLFAVWYRQIDEVTPDGLSKVAKLKGHMDDAAVGPTGVIGAGRDFGIGVVNQGAKRGKYDEPFPQKRGEVVALANGYLAGASTGLWASENGATWARVADFGDRGTARLCGSTHHAVVLATTGEVFTIRLDGPSP